MRRGDEKRNKAKKLLTEAEYLTRRIRELESDIKRLTTLPKLRSTNIFTAQQIARDRDLLVKKVKDLGREAERLKWQAEQEDIQENFEIATAAQRRNEANMARAKSAKSQPQVKMTPNEVNALLARLRALPSASDSHSGSIDLRI